MRQWSTKPPPEDCQEPRAPQRALLKSTYSSGTSSNVWCGYLHKQAVAGLRSLRSSRPQKTPLAKAVGIPGTTNGPFWINTHVPLLIEQLADISNAINGFKSNPLAHIFFLTARSPFDRHKHFSFYRSANFCSCDEPVAVTINEIPKTKTCGSHRWETPA